MQDWAEVFVLFLRVTPAFIMAFLGAHVHYCQTKGGLPPPTWVPFDHSEINVKAPRDGTGERGFMSLVFPIKGSTQIDLLCFHPCGKEALGCRTGILPPVTGAGDHSANSHLVSTDLQAALPRMGWEGFHNNFRGCANPATALLFIHSALESSTLLILLKRYQEQADITSEHRRL